MLLDLRSLLEQTGVRTYVGTIAGQSAVAAAYLKVKVPPASIAGQSGFITGELKVKVPPASIAAQSGHLTSWSSTHVPGVVYAGHSSVVSLYSFTKKSKAGRRLSYAGYLGLPVKRPVIEPTPWSDFVPATVVYGRFPTVDSPVEFLRHAPARVAAHARPTAETAFVENRFVYVSAVSTPRPAATVEKTFTPRADVRTSATPANGDPWTWLRDQEDYELLGAA